MRIWVLALVLAFAVVGPPEAIAKDAKLVKLRDGNPKPAAKARLEAKPAPKKPTGKRVVKKAPVRKRVVAKKKSKSKREIDDDDDDRDRKKPELRPMP